MLGQKRLFYFNRIKILSTYDNSTQLTRVNLTDHPPKEGPEPEGKDPLFRLVEQGNFRLDAG
jgi:hypothetical protein